MPCSLEQPIPPLPEQRAITHILGTLDDKIELNRRMSETLEAMARALFKSWFVDFDPVRQNMQRKAAKAQRRKENIADLASSRPGAFAFPPHILDLFPDHHDLASLGADSAILGLNRNLACIRAESCPSSFPASCG